MRPTFLLINPWIHDFAAYDFWLKPLGLITLAGALKAAGAEVSFLDCVDPYHPAGESLASRLKRRADGRGRLLSEEIPKPAPLAEIPRRFKRYGLPPEIARNILAAMPRPDAVLVGSTMTYWYPGVAETVSLVKQMFPGAPVLLGGLYATLLTEHARAHTGADLVLPGGWEDSLATAVAELTRFSLALPAPLAVSPDWSGYARLEYGVVLTGRGCRQSCRYCVAHRLHPRLERREPAVVVEEIAAVHRERGVRDFAFYDDALLADFERHLCPILEGLIRLKLPLRLHAPNGLSLREVTPAAAELLRQSGFVTLRFGLETTDPTRQQWLGPKALIEDLHQALACLKRAGYKAQEVGVYLLAGLPGQTVAEVETALKEVKRTGARPYLSEYSPIPGSGLWEESVAAARFDIAGEPLFHNCSLMSCAGPEWTPQALSRLRRLGAEGS